MTKFIENVNAYLLQRKIKQTYVSLKTGIHTKKLSRILTGVQDVNAADMEKIAASLGQKTEFFLGENMELPQIGKFEPEKVLFYAGEPTKKQEQMAGRLIELMENIDEVMSAKQRFLNVSEE